MASRLFHTVAKDPPSFRRSRCYFVCKGTNLTGQALQDYRPSQLDLLDTVPQFETIPDYYRYNQGPSVSY